MPFLVALRRRILAGALASAVLAHVPLPALAGAADIVRVEVRAASGGRFDFDVTVRSEDRGWQHYADRFEVLAPDGRVLGVRELLHPHDDEQPFTRELYGVAVPAGLAEVLVRARHKPLGYDGAVMRVRLPPRR